MRSPKPTLTEQELEIMKIVWACEQATVRDVYEELLKRRKIAYTTVMTVLVVVGIVAASLLAGKTTPVRVGFSGGSQALERTFTASAAALGANVTVSDIADVAAGLLSGV